MFAPPRGPSGARPFRPLPARVLVCACALALGGPLAACQRKGKAPGQDAGAAAAPAGLTDLNRSADLHLAGRHAQAIAAARRYLAAHPDSADAYNNLAVSYLALRLHDDAQRAIREALRLKPTFELAANNAKWIEQERAKASASRPLGPPSSAEALLEQSAQACQAKKYPECIDLAREALRQKPGLAVAFNNIAVGYVSLGLPDEAIVAAREALRLQPDFALARGNLAWAENVKKEQAARPR